MRVIFLDFDGVLVNRNSFTMNRIPFRSASFARADPECVKELNRVIEKTGAKVVVSSAWRLGRNRKEMFAFVKTVLAGWKVKAEVIGMTPDLSRVSLATQTMYVAVARGKEIRTWIEKRKSEIEFVILDDDSDMDGLSDRHVKTNFKVGLTAKDADKGNSDFGNKIIRKTDGSLQGDRIIRQEERCNAKPLKAAPCFP